MERLRKACRKACPIRAAGLWCIQSADPAERTLPDRTPQAVRRPRSRYSSSISLCLENRNKQMPRRLPGSLNPSALRIEVTDTYRYTRSRLCQMVRRLPRRPGKTPPLGRTLRRGRGLKYRSSDSGQSLVILSKRIACQTPNSSPLSSFTCPTGLEPFQSAFSVVIILPSRISSTCGLKTSVRTSSRPLISSLSFVLCPT